MSRRRTRFRHKGEEYVSTYRNKGEKWINQCVQCQARGYKPDMPDIVMEGHFYGDRGGFAARYIRKYFKPLALDERGLCEVCSNR